jgi:hypothetical protein
MSAVMTATSIYDCATTVLATASVALSGLGRPVTRVFFQPGAEVADDGCECGELAFFVLNRDVGRGLFTAAQGQVQNCDPTVRFMSMGLRLMRCVPGVDEAGRPPMPAKLTASARDLEADSFVVWDAVQCALRGMEDTFTIAAFIINEQMSVGPLGDCVGTELHFQVGWYRDCACTR